MYTILKPQQTTNAPTSIEQTTETLSTEVTSTESPSPAALSTTAPSTDVLSTEATTTSATSAEVPSTELPSTQTPTTEATTLDTNVELSPDAPFYVRISRSTEPENSFKILTDEVLFNQSFLYIFFEIFLRFQIII